MTVSPPRGWCDMAQAKLLLDTNVVVDYLNECEPFYEKARLLMIGGRVGEFELWISSSQVTDLVYILSNGGRTSEMDGTTQRTTSFTKSPWRLEPMPSSHATSPISPRASFPSWTATSSSNGCEIRTASTTARLNSRFDGASDGSRSQGIPCKTHCLFAHRGARGWYHGSRENDGTEERSEGKRRGELGSRLPRAFDLA